MSNLLVEQMNSALEYDDTSTSNRLGRLKGVCADFCNATRNGRLYGKELWENVLKDPEVIEGLETKTLFGEADHPEDRLETSLKNVAISVVDLKLDESNGVVVGTFDILDTPSGKILKSLADYGAQIGVSSRGSGEVVESMNGPEVDPSTYKFITFDAVVMPAVVKARPSVVESSKSISSSKMLVESIESNIKSATTKEELDLLRSVVSKTSVSNKDSLLESIDNKLSSTSNAVSGSEALASEIRKLSEEVSHLKDVNSKLKLKAQASGTRCKEKSLRLESTLSTSKSLVEENKKLQSINSELSEKIERLDALRKTMKSSMMDKSRKVRELNRQIESLQSDLDAKLDLVEENDRLHDLCEKLKHKCDVVARRYKEASKESKASIQKTQHQITESVRREESWKSKYKEKELELTKEKKLVEDTTHRARSLNKVCNDFRTEYVKSQCQLYGLNESEILNRMTHKMTLKEVKNLIDSKVRVHDTLQSTLPYHTTQLKESLRHAKVELVGSDVPRMSDEDAQTNSFLDAYSHLH